MSSTYGPTALMCCSKITRQKPLAGQTPWSAFTTWTVPSSFGFTSTQPTSTVSRVISKSTIHGVERRSKYKSCQQLVHQLSYYNFYSRLSPTKIIFKNEMVTSVNFSLTGFHEAVRKRDMMWSRGSQPVPAIYSLISFTRLYLSTRISWELWNGPERH